MRKWWIGIWCLFLLSYGAYSQDKVHQQNANSFADSMLKASKANADASLDDLEETSASLAPADDAEDLTPDEEEDMDESEAEESESQSLEWRRISDEDWGKVLADTNFKYKKEKIKSFKKLSKPSPWLEGLGWFLNSGFFKFLLYLLIACIVVFVVYSIFSNSELRFRNLFTSKGKKQEEFSVDNVAEFNDWDKALQEALKQADYRTAMRILYLSLLHQLNEKSHIRLEHEKTNWDYVHECSSREYHIDFTLLTRYFDYVWYGEFALQENSFAQLHEIAKRLHQKIATS